jgi:hypothetical protein
LTDIDKKTIGRNDPCHCGSGKKYKSCHLEADETAAREARQAEQAKKEAEAPAPAEGATDAPAAEHAHPPREPRHNTSQPWKKSAGGPRSVPRFNAPRRSGGS